jgi:predicted membrane channel-forming protein YqfA (hemolysin III family)
VRPEFAEDILDNGTLDGNTIIKDLISDMLEICSLGAGCTVVSVVSKFRTPAWRPFRAAMFVAMGLSAVFPVLQGLQLYGVSQMKKQIGLFWLVSQGVLYILGAGIYAVKFSTSCRMVSDK